MEIIVNDTNIFIDLHSCGLLDSFFKLPYKVHTTDLVMNELTKGTQHKDVVTFCEQGHLTIKSFSSKEVVRIWEYYTEAKKVCNVSIEDCSVLIYTKMLGSARLLTGDELVNHNIISPKDAAVHLESLYESNVRLPKEEVEKRLEQWK